MVAGVGGFCNGPTAAVVFFVGEDGCFFLGGHSEIVFGGNRFFGGKSNRVFFFFQKVNFVAKRTFWT